MATLTDDRGQLLIIAAVGFAILLVLLTVALHTAVYADVHVTQADDGSHEERAALRYVDAVQRAMPGLVPPAAANDDGYEELTRQLERNVAEWDNLSSEHTSGDGVWTDTRIRNVSFASRIVQENSSRSFENQTGTSNWTVAADVRTVETFTMTVANESLAAIDDCRSNDACFTLVVVGDGGSEWTLRIYSETGTSGHEIVADAAGNTAYKTNDTSLRIDIEEGVFDPGGTGTNFSTFLDVDGLSPPYTMRYVTADAVTGTYNLSVAGKAGIEESNFGPSASPRVTLRIERVAVPMGYRSAGLEFRSVVSVTPGDSDD